MAVAWGGAGCDGTEARVANVPTGLQSDSPSQFAACKIGRHSGAVLIGRQQASKEASHLDTRTVLAACCQLHDPVGEVLAAIHLHKFLLAR